MTNEPASPPCYADQGSDLYMGYIGEEELVAALNELLEAERAGAKVALASTRTPDPGLGDLMRSVRADEARWCAMLARHIRRLGQTPSRRTGAFHGKAMAIADPIERLTFLNRGQSWVVRKLETLTPQVRDEALHADLRAMLDSHRANIRLADSFLDSASE